MFKKILLINTPDDEKPINRDMAGGLGFDRSTTTILPPLDLLSYATYLDQKGYSVRLFDAQVEMSNKEHINGVISQFQPDIVIVTLSLPSLDKDIEFAKWLKVELSYNCEIVLKTGIRHQPTLEKMLRESGCSYCIIGECDLSIEQILKGETLKGTARLYNGRYKEEDDILLKDLNLLPELNRKFLKNERYCYPTLGPKTTTMQTSRGCPFSCSYYCPYPLVQGKSWRAMSALRIVQEIKTIVYEEQITNILFRDATFTLDNERIKELCRLIMEQSLKVSWWCETRVDRLDADLLDMMKAAGCVGLNVGVETGDEGLLEKKAKAGMSVSDIVNLTRHCKDIGVRIRFLLMLGLPGETKQSLYATFRLVDELCPDFIGLTTVTPYPGTPFYAEAIENNWITNPDINTFGGHGYNVEIAPLTSGDYKFAMNRIHAIHSVDKDKDASGKALKQQIRDSFLKWLGE